MAKATVLKMKDPIPPTNFLQGLGRNRTPESHPSGHVLIHCQGTKCRQDSAKHVGLAPLLEGLS